jgi:hypothetical protein
LYDVRLRTRFAVDAGDFDSELDVLDALLRGEAFAVKNDAAGVAVRERDVRRRPGRDSPSLIASSAKKLHDRRRADGRCGQRGGHAGLMHRTLERVGHDRKIRDRESTRQGRNAPMRPTLSRT